MNPPGDRRWTGRLGSAILGPVLRVRTYKQLLYLLLSIPLGLLYSVILGMSLIVGIAFSLVVVGVVILALSLLFVRVFSGFERWLANRLLSVTVEKPDEDISETELRTSLRNVVDAASTWRGLGFLTLKFWLSLVGVLLVVGLSIAYSLIQTLVDRPRGVEFGEVNDEPVVWTVESVPEAAIAGIAGVLLLLLLLHLSNLFGYVSGRLAVALLS